MSEVTSYTELIGAIRDRVGELGLRYEDFDEHAGFASGLAGKVFGPAQVKRLGPEKLFDALRAAGLRIRVEEDPEQTAKMVKRIAENYLPRVANNARMGNSASPISTALTSRVFKHFSRLGNRARWRNSTPQQRSEHARMMAMAGVKKRRKEVKRRTRQRKRAHEARKVANDAAA